MQHVALLITSYDCSFTFSGVAHLDVRSGLEVGSVKIVTFTDIRNSWFMRKLIN